MSVTRELRDRMLAQDGGDMLSQHRVLSALALSVQVRGGVAHVRGAVASDRQRQQVRAAIARMRGIHAVWDVLDVPGAEEHCVVDLGCGNTKQHDCAIGIDRHAYPAVDVIAHLEQGLPLGNETADQVFAAYFLEHMQDLIGVMNEVHRVLKPGGVLHVMVPNWQFVNAVADPTHVRFFHVQTFKFFCREYPGLRLFRPLAVGASEDNVFADLQPVKPGEPAAAEGTLCRFFD